VCEYGHMGSRVPVTITFHAIISIIKSIVSQAAKSLIVITLLLIL
jgi:hypothetical protein